MPAFAVANVAAFCTYFATFAIFFFTALYLEEVVGYSGGHIALVFLPMTVLMILTSVLAGRWTGLAGAALVAVRRVRAVQRGTAAGQPQPEPASGLLVAGARRSR